MKTVLTIALAAATLGGAVLASAAPAEARDRDDRGGWHEGRDHDRGWREHEGWRERGGWRRDRDYGDGWRYRSGAFFFGVGPRCYTSWRWNPYWGRNVRVTRCY